MAVKPFLRAFQTQMATVGWELVRVPASLGPALPLDPALVNTLGRRDGENTLVCQGSTVSRRHLQFTR